MDNVSRLEDPFVTLQPDTAFGTDVEPYDMMRDEICEEADNECINVITASLASLSDEAFKWFKDVYSDDMNSIIEHAENQRHR